MESIELESYKKTRLLVKKLKELAQDTKAFKLIMPSGHDFVIIPILKPEDPPTEVEKPYSNYSSYNTTGYSSYTNSTTTATPPVSSKSVLISDSMMTEEERRQEFSKRLESRGSTVGAMLVGDVDIWKRNKEIFYTYDSTKIEDNALYALRGALQSLFSDYAIISEPDSMPPGGWTKDPVESGWIWLDY